MKYQEDDVQKINAITSNVSNSSYLTPECLISTSDSLMNLAENEEHTADVLMTELDIKNENIPKIKETVH